MAKAKKSEKPKKRTQTDIKLAAVKNANAKSPPAQAAKESAEETAYLAKGNLTSAESREKRAGLRSSRVNSLEAV